MARVTVEDCILQVTNRFDLVLVAAQRAREISSGSQLTIERDNDKNPVVALREIADKTIEPSILMESLIKDHQKHVEVDEPVEEEMDLLAIQQELLNEGSEIQTLPDVEGDEDLIGGDEDADEASDGAGGDSGRSTDEDHGAIG